MVGWTIVNRMKSHQYDRVYSVIFDHGHRQYASNQPATSQTPQIACEILSGRARDISWARDLFLFTAGHAERKGCRIREAWKGYRRRSGRRRRCGR
ncbi:cell wall hydrolase [Asaia sp. As-1742]|nr:cell wall hydrolase [Asaia sp. As-1742]